MNFIAKNLKYLAIACVSAVIGICATNVIGQETAIKGKTTENRIAYGEKVFCSNNNWSDEDRVSISDLREMTVVSSGALTVDAGRNGGISVKGEDRNDVLVKACVQAWGPTEEAARSLAAGINVNTSSEIKADGPRDSGWSVSFQIVVPKNTNTKLTAHNGGISISNVDGNAEFETTNGGVVVTNAAGSVKGRTMNGGVNVFLSGATWKGSGIDIETKNGGVTLIVPENFAANIETGTVNGGFKSDIPSLNVTTEDYKGESWGRSRSHRLTTALNGGGPLVRVVTTNGGVKISTRRAE